MASLRWSRHDEAMDCARMAGEQMAIAVVIPCYRVKAHVLDVIARIPDTVSTIHVVDDKCPEASGLHVQAHCRDARVSVLFNDTNLGVGGAVMAGYAHALQGGADIVVKIDGDGQMDPAQLDRFVEAIALRDADYVKGNRFFDPDDLAGMPKLRLFGNAGLSLMNKLSSGYWDIFDPTNGYTAISRRALQGLPLHKISQRYFFETDMLFRLGLMRAVVMDLPMRAHYGDEISNLRIHHVLPEFLAKHIRNFLKRVLYQYFLRDVSIASIELVCGLLLGIFSLTYGGYHWIHSARAGIETPVGTVVLSAVAILAAFQLLLSFLNFDIASVPRQVLGRYVHAFRLEKAKTDD